MTLAPALLRLALDLSALTARVESVAADIALCVPQVHFKQSARW